MGNQMPRGLRHGLKPMAGGEDAKRPVDLKDLFVAGNGRDWLIRRRRRGESLESAWDAGRLFSQQWAGICASSGGVRAVCSSAIPISCFLYRR